MKKSLLIILILYLSVTLFGCGKSDDSSEESYVEEVEEPSYLIEYSPSEEDADTARVISLKGEVYTHEFYYPDGSKTRRDYDLWGFGDSLSKGYQEVAEKFIINQVTEINYEMCDASVTRELLLSVEPKDYWKKEE